MKTLAFTFDDGIRSHYDKVFPLLKSFSMKGTFFITNNHTLWKKGIKGIEEHDGYDLIEDVITWKEAKEMSDEGFEIGNHSMSHINFTKINKNRMKYEIFSLEEIFADNDIPLSKSFCYPGYHCDEDSINLLKDIWNFKFARTGYVRGEQKGGNKPKLRNEIHYYNSYKSNPFIIYSTGIFNDWYSLKDFISDVERAPKNCVSVFTAHSLARKSRWIVFKKMIEYVDKMGYKTINMRDLPESINV